MEAGPSRAIREHPDRNAASRATALQLYNFSNDMRIPLLIEAAPRQLAQQPYAAAAIIKLPISTLDRILGIWPPGHRAYLSSAPCFSRSGPQVPSLNGTPRPVPA